MIWRRPGAPHERPLAWSVPIGRAWGIRFRVHASFVAYGALQFLAATLGPEGATPLRGGLSTAMALAALLAVVLLRESVRAMVVRSAGGSAEEVVLWPLGSLEGIDPAPGWLSALLSASVGLATSAVLALALGVTLAAAGGGAEAALPNPWSAAWLSNPHPRWMEFGWILHWTGLQVAALNLLPMLPLDGGRAVEALAVRRSGPFDAPRVAASATIGAAAVVAAVAVARGLSTVLAVGLACGGFAAVMLWRIRAGDSVAAAGRPWRSTGFPVEAEEHGPGDASGRSPRDGPPDAAQEDRELDRVLGKIASEGAGSLTTAERELLARATERRRAGGR